MATESKWRLILAADVDTAEADILEWAGLSALWYGDDRLPLDFSVIDDVVAKCLAGRVDERELDGGAPGYASTVYRVFTNDPRKLKREMRARVNELLAEIAKRDNPLLAASVTEFLRIEAEALEGITTPGGYGNLARADGAKLRAALAEYPMLPADHAHRQAFLTQLAGELRSAVRDRVRTLADNLDRYSDA
jgi:hypothetical protein